MFYFMLILFVWNSAVALDAVPELAVNVSIPLHSDVNRTLVLNKTEKSVITNDSSSSPHSSSSSDLYSSLPKNVSKELLSKKISQISPKKQLPDTSKKESVQNHGSTRKPVKVVTEGGSSVSTVDNSVNNFQGSRETSSKVIFTEGGDQGVISDKIENVTPKQILTPQILSNNDYSSKLQGIEASSSMNEGKITARKGVVDPKQINSASLDDKSQVVNTSSMTQPPLTTIKNNELLQTTGTNVSHVRMAKPLVTDDGSESVSGVKSVDYIVPIVCTAFSVPLLIVLAVYLYKKGSDFWERRHYNRMDFLIEGIYNE